MITEAWLGYHDQVCKVANLRDPFFLTFRNYHECISETTIHTVGQWWRREETIEIRFLLKLLGCKFQHHLILPAGAWSSILSESLRKLYEGVPQHIDDQLHLSCSLELCLLQISALVVQP